MLPQQSLFLIAYSDRIPLINIRLRMQFDIIKARIIHFLRRKQILFFACIIFCNVISLEQLNLVTFGLSTSVRQFGRR
jgi:hypothetical protein